MGHDAVPFGFIGNNAEQDNVIVYYFHFHRGACDFKISQKLCFEFGHGCLIAQEVRLVLGVFQVEAIDDAAFVLHCLHAFVNSTKLFLVIILTHEIDFSEVAMGCDLIWPNLFVFIQFHKRLLDILEPTQQTVDALGKLSLPAGVDVEIKL